ncbi:Na+/H+ antiporter NhaA [Bizionia paragorgiae]|uniref:Na(+)/H(+) antiporter NhaA n=1 Tax=Bizionia paragorgiae TaxID=283786 RepID=A0A1H3ZBT4_BIZPA|nr:Na+/H+ antiporter NhaA [Bizionia paragorgiae]MDX1271938.1 Na+/H+ antiporter NhaA [Bizionia paragorgiae]SEA20812.1 sodium/proton antiporter, NhaA family [Bizionia paragorgiae]
MIKRIILSPIQKFVKTESLAGILLFSATIIALIWANSPFVDSYQQLWEYKIGISFENFELKKPLSLWINDGLMAIFFFLIGLELKRELLIGEINTVKKAAFPLVAALGGMIIPVVMFLTLNQDADTTKAWGIPMATDIAFALAILSTLGKRVPLSLKIFLTAFAIIDDIAAVLVIAIFYSTDINWDYILYGVILIGILAAFYNKKKYTIGIGLVLAVIIWFLFLKSGIHPTIAGVLLAFTIPIKRRINLSLFSKNLTSISEKIITESDGKEKHLLSNEEINHIDDLDNLTEAVRSPLQDLEQRLHHLTAYFILPVFAFSNAGVVISMNYNFNFELLTNIAISLFIGKFIGVALFSYLGYKLKITRLPEGVRFIHILGIACIAGVGFTMSIFIGNLAFSNDLTNINSVKVGIILGSLLAGVSGYLILRLSGKKPIDKVASETK